MMNRFLYILSLLIVSCTPQKTINEFVYKYEQDAEFDSADFNTMMTYNGNILDENQLNDSICWNRMALIDSIFLKQSKVNIYIYKFLSNKFGENICYASKDKVKLVGYSSKEADLSIYYVNKKVEFKEVILELINSKKFDREKPLPKRDGSVSNYQMDSLLI